VLTPFDPEKHLETVRDWSAARGVALDPETLPRMGFITGAAVGWLYQTDSAVGFLEHFITNPKAPAKDRHRGVDAIGLALIEKARGLGLRSLVSMTSHRSIGRMMVRRGFVYSGPMHVLRREV
jgi:hypothetical protein